MPTRIHTFPTYPPSLTVLHDPIEIGVTHSHQCLPIRKSDASSAIARQMDADVLGSGHGKPQIGEGDITPPLASMDIRRSVTRTYLYELVEGEVRVEGVEYRKTGGTTSSPTNANYLAATLNFATHITTIVR
ncbi:vacuolar protein sorting-associated protein 29 [Moniliophthora roreri]|nr:vacuolar protein sorting-associated protein 29 [Moniliophthora roreri]